MDERKQLYIKESTEDYRIGYYTNAPFTSKLFKVIQVVSKDSRRVRYPGINKIALNLAINSNEYKF